MFARRTLEAERIARRVEEAQERMLPKGKTKLEAFALLVIGERSKSDREFIEN